MRPGCGTGVCEQVRAGAEGQTGGDGSVQGRGLLPWPKVTAGQKPGRALTNIHTEESGKHDGMAFDLV